MRRRIGRPSLLGTAARTAVITGTAAATMNAMAPKTAPPQARAVEAPPPPAAPAASAGGLSDETIAKLKQLGELRDSGVLTEAEFTTAKAQLLGLG